MDALAILRAATANVAARSVGLRPQQPNVTVSQQQATQSQSDVFHMPHDATGWQPLQVTDTGSPRFGDFYFLPGYDIPGDPSKVVR